MTIVNPSDKTIGLEAAAGILDRVGGDLLELGSDYQHPISDQARQKLPPYSSVLSPPPRSPS